jgi:hypothetical protein
MRDSLRLFTCIAPGCNRPEYVCCRCDRGQVYCAECREPRRIQVRRSSRQRYQKSSKGRRATARRVRNFRARALERSEQRAAACNKHRPAALRRVGRRSFRVLDGARDFLGCSIGRHVYQAPSPASRMEILGKQGGDLIASDETTLSRIALSGPNAVRPILGSSGESVGGLEAK